jgi:molybdopterin adenylyltransferase
MTTRANIRAGVLTISDKGSVGERKDTSGAALRELLAALPAEVARSGIVADEIEQIQGTLTAWCDRDRLDLIITTGGTGFSPRDVTPEATAAIIERPTPGISEAIRLESLKKTPHGMLSRAVSGIRGRTLIINMPGSERAVRESFAAIAPALPHALETLTGRGGECGGG